MEKTSGVEPGMTIIWYNKGKVFEKMGEATHGIHPEGTTSKELIRINHSVRVIYLFINNPLLMPACHVASTVGNINIPQGMSLTSKELIIWRGGNRCLHS